MKKLNLLMLLILVSLMSPALASYISLNTTVTAQVEQDVLKVSVKVVNQGDESAHNVQAEVRVNGKNNFAQKQAVLEVNQTYAADLTFDLKLDTPGLYPLVLVMHYTDANSYPFSALTAQTFAFGSQEFPSELFGKISAKTFWKRGKVKLDVKNMSEIEIEANTHLVLPREVTTEDEIINVSLPPKKEKGINFSVDNFSALSGSSYQVYAITEYEKQGVHQTSITPGIIKLVESKQILGLDFKAIIIFLVILIVLFIVIQIFRRK